MHGAEARDSMSLSEREFSDLLYLFLAASRGGEEDITGIANTIADDNDHSKNSAQIDLGQGKGGVFI